MGCYEAFSLLVFMIYTILYHVLVHLFISVTYFIFSSFFITIKIELGTQIYRIKFTVPSKAGKDTNSSSPHFEWHLQFFNKEMLKVQTSFMPNDVAQILFLLLENHPG